MWGQRRCGWASGPDSTKKHFFLFIVRLLRGVRMRCRYPGVRASRQHIFPGCCTVTSLARSAAARNQGFTATRINVVSQQPAPVPNTNQVATKMNECSKNIWWEHAMSSVPERWSAWPTLGTTQSICSPPKQHSSKRTNGQQEQSSHLPFYHLWKLNQHFPCKPNHNNVNKVANKATLMHNNASVLYLVFQKDRNWETVYFIGFLKQICSVFNGSWWIQPICIWQRVWDDQEKDANCERICLISRLAKQPLI